MEDRIKNIITTYCDQIKNEANTETISKSVKSIDTIIQKMYMDLYGLRDIRYNCVKPEDTEKKGHCC